MLLPLVVLAGLSIVGGALQLPFSTDLHFLEKWLEPVIEFGEADIHGFWQEAEECVSARREETNAKLEQLRAETEQRLQTEGNLLRSNLLLAARNKAMESRLHAEAALEKRLLQQARQQFEQ